MRPEDPYSTFVGYGYDVAASSSNWYLSTWQNGYATQELTTIEEPLSFPAQAVFAGKISNNNRIIRLFYGPTFPQSGQIRIDVLNPTRDQSTQRADTSLNTQSQLFAITWPATDPSNYLTWFLADVNGDGMLDLVTLVVPPTSELIVVVFPGQVDSTFGQPVVSNITLDPSQGTLLNAAFMKPLTTGQAQFGSPTSADSSKQSKSTKDSKRIKTLKRFSAFNNSYQSSVPSRPDTASANMSSNAIMTIFDNYGVAGARLLAPIAPSGTYTYELKGQTPAIAGQHSTSLGEMDGSWMGREQPVQAIGFFFR